MSQPSAAPLPVEPKSPGYWAASRQPLASLVFIAPWLAVYEAGVLALGAKAMRNGADAWLRTLLERMDFGQYFLLPVLVVGTLLAWHYTTRQAWRFGRTILWGMTAECLLLALALRIASDLEAWALCRVAGLTPMASPASTPASLTPDTLAGLIGFLGAGIYEELLFRLILFSAAAWAIRGSGATPLAATVAAAVATSALFALAHHVGPYGEPIVWRELAFWHALVFRFLAGVFFSALFALRGFGIAAGTHAAYDILAKLL